MPKSKRNRNGAIALLFLLPYLVLWGIFAFVPIVYGFFISLHKWNPIGTSKFIGFQNYGDLFRNPRFVGALWNTLIYAAWAIPLILLVGLVFALLLRRGQLPGGAAVEAALFFPYLLNVSVVGILWRFLLDPDVGIVPYYLRVVGVDPPNFLNSPMIVLPTIAVVSAWWLAGYRMIVFRAGLNAIPDDLYEAASLDGAGSVRQFFFITLPLMRPSILFAAILTLVAGMCMLGQVLVMTNGGPGTASEVMALFMYRTAFESFNFGQAAAVGFILFVIVFGVSLVLFRVLGLRSELS
ncbi:carbohydrate ABC transporter permease [Jiella sonneratiae]|uniref:Sugar ABC transporter permease n=1 Tax=Jiella sonneratiae TaxID=2816856 RepID=A0ABS3J3J5_9HYPH|nr:sugar ABC transporter permease [Jiella sonneratiae]MBO0904232.1 sugar ABC transporter permease [Jiella sonneratiae]